MRIEDVVRALKDRQSAMQETVFKKESFDRYDFAKAQGRWQGIAEAISIISDQMRKESDEDRD